MISMLPQFFDDGKKVKGSVYGSPVPGCFAIECDSFLSWEKCREQFACKFTEKLYGFYFCHKPQEGYNVAAFISKTEEIIGFVDFVNSYGPSKFYKTDKIDVLWIEPSIFWLKQEMRRQLFTILLRAGMNYKNTYEDALWREKYAQETYAAVTRFLFGFTDYVDDCKKTGWVTTFQNCSKKTVRKLLVRPKSEKKECSIIGIDELWS